MFIVRIARVLVVAYVRASVSLLLLLLLWCIVSCALLLGYFASRTSLLFSARAVARGWQPTSRCMAYKLWVAVGRSGNRQWSCHMRRFTSGILGVQLRSERSGAAHGSPQKTRARHECGSWALSSQPFHGDGRFRLPPRRPESLPKKQYAPRVCVFRVNKAKLPLPYFQHVRCGKTRKL